MLKSRGFCFCFLVSTYSLSSSHDKLYCENSIKCLPQTADGGRWRGIFSVPSGSVALYCEEKKKLASKLYSKTCCFGFQTRVVSQNHNERCFHIFYQLCVGATSEMKGERHWPSGLFNQPNHYGVGCYKWQPQGLGGGGVFLMEKKSIFVLFSSASADRVVFSVHKKIYNQLPLKRLPSERWCTGTWNSILCM